MKKMTCARAEALRQLLRLTEGEIALGLNRLAGTSHSARQAAGWFRNKPPAPHLVLYLRSVLKARWHRRIALRALGHAGAKTSIHTRTRHFIEQADPATLIRYEKRLKLSELDLAAAQARAEG